MIASGVFQRGALIPAEKKLTVQLGATLGEVRLAVNKLASEGRLDRIPRKGTVVTNDNVTRSAAATATWAVILPTMEYFYAPIVNTIEQETRANGTSLWLRCFDEELDRERQSVWEAVEHGVSGIILAPAVTPETRPAESLEYLGELPVPVVILDHWSIDLPLSGVDAVLSDNFAGTYQSTVHMIRHGYKAISLVHSENDSREMRERLSGYLAALHDHDLEEPEIFARVRDVEDGRIHLLQAQLDAGTDAFVTTNDNTASILIRKLRELGLSVPDDIGVIGYDDEDFARIVDPPLSSVHVEKHEIAKRAVELLQQRIESGKKGRHRTVVIRPTVVARGSCGRNCLTQYQQNGPQARRLQQ